MTQVEAAVAAVEEIEVEHASYAPSMEHAMEHAMEASTARPPTPDGASERERDAVLVGSYVTELVNTSWLAVDALSMDSANAMGALIGGLCLGACFITACVRIVCRAKAQMSTRGRPRRVSRVPLNVHEALPMVDDYTMGGGDYDDDDGDDMTYVHEMMSRSAAKMARNATRGMPRMSVPRRSYRY